MKGFLENFCGIFLTTFLVLGGIASAGSQTGGIGDDKQSIRTAMRGINEVMEAHVKELMELPGVVGVFIGALDDGTPCIKVMVIKTTSELEEKIPNYLEGHPVLILETGEIKPLSKPPDSP